MLFKNEVENVPVLKCVAGAVTDNGLSKFHVRNIANTYLKLCQQNVSPNMTEMIRDLDLIYSGMYYTVLELLDLEVTSDHIDACSHIGKAYGIMEVIRAFEHAKDVKSVMVSRDIIEACDCDIGDFFTGKNTIGTRKVVTKLIEMMIGEMSQGMVAARCMSRHHRKLLFYYPMVC